MYISEEVDNMMYEYIKNTLTSNGYKHYEISNYAKAGYESVHNKNYWLNGNYYGFGLGAVSYLDNTRISNTKNLGKYLQGNYLDNCDYEDEKTNKENDLILLVVGAAAELSPKLKELKEIIDDFESIHFIYKQAQNKKK